MMSKKQRTTIVTILFISVLLLALLTISTKSNFLHSKGRVCHAQESPTSEANPAPEASPDTDAAATETPSKDKETGAVGEEDTGNQPPRNVMYLLFLPLVLMVLFFVYINFANQDSKPDAIATDRLPVDPEVLKKKQAERERRQRLREQQKSYDRVAVPLDLFNLQDFIRDGSLKTDIALKCTQGRNKDKIFEITKHHNTVGRRSKNGRINDIQVSSFEKKVSRSQGLVLYDKEKERFYMVNESDVPILVNGRRVKPRDAAPFYPGDEIVLGESVVFQVIDKTEQQ
ncbi:MAG: FHA domain-containing protein [Vulcanimicrobiota bacterium]